MKKLIYFATIAFAVSFLSCHKADTETTITKTEIINVVLDANKTYMYDLGTRQQADVQIISPASHASLSKISIVPGSANATSNVSYQYAPENNYSGSDQVTVRVNENQVNQSGGRCGNQQKQSGSCGNGKNGQGGGKCGKPNGGSKVENEMITEYVFKITINNSGFVK